MAPKSKKEKQFLKCQFTHDEIHAKGVELARITSEATSLENEKKAVISQCNAKLDGKQAEIEVIGNHINSGYEHRYIECTIVYNDPNTGMKTIYRDDTGEAVRSDSMSHEEMQLEFDL